MVGWCRSPCSCQDFQGERGPLSRLGYNEPSTQPLTHWPTGLCNHLSESRGLSPAPPTRHRVPPQKRALCSIHICTFISIMRTWKTWQLSWREFSFAYKLSSQTMNSHRPKSSANLTVIESNADMSGFFPDSRVMGETLRLSGEVLTMSSNSWDTTAHETHDPHAVSLTQQYSRGTSVLVAQFWSLPPGQKPHPTRLCNWKCLIANEWTEGNRVSTERGHMATYLLD